MINNTFSLSQYSNDPHQVITPIDLATRFPEVLEISIGRYQADIELFRQLANDSFSSSELLEKIRGSGFNAKQRMTLLKIFRRCVCPIVDTEMAKKLKVTTATLVSNYGEYFKDIFLVKDQFNNFSQAHKAALAALVGEYDTRGQSGYILTGWFFDWFNQNFSGQFHISGPRGAGRDIELRTLYDSYEGDFPCDFVITDNQTNVCAIGFARYDATRGGAQSDDRTGGNADKVSKASQFCKTYGHRFRIIFLSDGPGLAHKDTWTEACRLDNSWEGAVRVTTLKTAPSRITPDWLLGQNTPSEFPPIRF